MSREILEYLLRFFDNEDVFFGGEISSQIVAINSVLLTCFYYFVYYLFAKFIRKMAIIRNYEIERIAFRHCIITNDQLMVKYTANLSSSSTMAALSVTMVLLSVAALFQTKLTSYNHFISIIVCALMTIASSALLFACELYDAIINPAFNPVKKFKLRKVGSNFQALGLLLFMLSMLLAISTVSTIATLISCAFSCVIMTIYIEKRLTSNSKKEDEVQAILNYHLGRTSNEHQAS